MRIIMLLAFCFFCTLGCVSEGVANDTVIRVSYNDLPPWKLLDYNGEPDGIDIRFLEALTDRMGLEIQYVYVPFKRGLSLLDTGEVDLMLGVLRRPDRELYAHFISPPYKTYSNKAFFVLNGKEATIKRHADLRSLNVGTQLGVKYYPEFDDDTAIKKVPVKDPVLNAKMLLAGRIDTYIFTESSGDYQLAQLGYTKRISKAQFGYRKKQDVYFALSKRSRYAGRLDEFNVLMRELVDAKVHDRIRIEFLKAVRDKALR